MAEATEHPGGAGESYATLESIVARFEDAWRRGERPSLADYLPAESPRRRGVLVELAHADLEFRLKAGESARVETYLAGHAELAEDATAVLDLLAAEYDFRRRREPDLTPAEYLHRFPQYQEQLEARLSATPPPEAVTGPESTIPESTPGGAVPASAPPSRYRPVAFHARGGLGEVLRAEDEELHREVALKRIREPHADDADSRRRFLREAEVTARLEHPGVVPVYGLVQDHAGRPCYAMRFVDGETLQDALERFHRADEGPRDPGERSLALRHLLNRFVALCNTVAFAHSRGVIHRDLKPANVMLGRYGETLLVDWGLARPLSPAAPDAPAAAADDPGNGTRVGQAVGTPAYMSPEQAEGRREAVGPASDVYGLGATLYALLTGAAPFAGSSVPDVLAKVRRGDFPPPRRRKAGVPRALEAVCLKAMAARPGDRYATAQQLADDVDKWLAGEPVTAYREPLAARLWRRVKRHRTLAAGAAALLVTAVVFLAVIAVLMDQARRDSQAEQARTARENRRARANLDRAVRAVDQMLTRLADERLAHLPAFDEDRRELLQEALALFRGLLDDNSTEPRARLETGKAHVRMGDVLLLLGRFPEAGQEYDAGIELLAKLAEEHPHVPEYDKALAHAHDQKGLRCWHDEGDPRRQYAAEDAFRRSLPIWDRLSREGGVEARAKVAIANYRLACILVHTRRHAEGEKLFGETVRLQQELLRTAAEPAHRGLLGSIHNSAGAHYLRTQQWARAGAMYRAALDIFVTLAPSHPRTLKYQYELGYGWNGLGVTSAAAGRQAEADAAYRKGMAVFAALVRAHPNLPEYEEEMASSLDDWATMYEQTNRLGRAAEAYRKAIVIRDKIAAAHPRPAVYPRALARTWVALGRVQGRAGQGEPARASFREALKVLDRLVKGDHDTTPDQIELARTRGLMGDSLSDGGKPADSLTWYAEALKVLAAVPPREPNVRDAREAMAQAYAGRARALARLGQYAEAVADWDRAVERADEPEATRFRVGRAVGLAQAGDRKRARAELAALAVAKELDGETLYELACGHTLTADGDGAIDLLRRARAAGYFKEAARVRGLRVDRRLAGVRGRPDFRALLRELEGERDEQPLR